MAAVEDPEIGVVKYSIKEMFARIETRLESIDTKLDHKVDDVSFLALGARVERLDRHDLAKDSVAQALIQRDQKFLSKRRYLWPLVISVASCLTYLLAILTPHIKF